jgi:hypothetical protein
VKMEGQNGPYKLCQMWGALGGWIGVSTVVPRVRRVVTAITSPPRGTSRVSAKLIGYPFAIYNWLYVQRQG